MISSPSTSSVAPPPYPGTAVASGGSSPAVGGVPPHPPPPFPSSSQGTLNSLYHESRKVFSNENTLNTFSYLFSELSASGRIAVDGVTETRNCCRCHSWHSSRVFRGRREAAHQIPGILLKHPLLGAEFRFISLIYIFIVTVLTSEFRDLTYLKRTALNWFGYEHMITTLRSSWSSCSAWVTPTTSTSWRSAATSGTPSSSTTCPTCRHVLGSSSMKQTLS